MTWSIIKSNILGVFATYLYDELIVFYLALFSNVLSSILSRWLKKEYLSVLEGLLISVYATTLASVKVMMNLRTSQLALSTVTFYYINT